jgi:hypothetical protein
MLLVSRKRIAGTCAILSLFTLAFGLGWVARGTTARVQPVAAARLVTPVANPAPRPQPVVRRIVVSPVVARVRARAARMARVRKHPAKKPVVVAHPVVQKSVPRVSVSLYERTVAGAVLARQGCHAGARGVGGLMILDFGKPAYNGHTYGTILFSNRFASNKSITRALYLYARNYVRCLPKGSAAQIVLARGTSNYHPSVPSAFKAGLKWARETQALQLNLEAHRLAGHVTSAAADDAEPAWDPHFRRTYSFFRGFQDGHTNRLIYNFGSLDGGVGAIWNARQAFFVAGGMRDSRALPEIYNHAMAHQWAFLAKIASNRYKRPVRFAGVMTQHHARFSMKPVDAHRALVRALAMHVGNQAPEVPRMLTNITAPG